jgi:hypothetical protein
MKIRFACLFGVDFEADLLPWWGPYYENMRFDSYKIFLHREHGLVPSDIIYEIINLGFSYEIITGENHANGVLRKLLMENYARSIDGADYLVTADADEFHSFQAPYLAKPIPPDYRTLLNYSDIITGFMSDRYGEDLTPCVTDPFVQYPYEEPFTGEILNNFTPPFLRATAWPKTRRTKIMAARAGAAVAYHGSHVMTTVNAKDRILDNLEVVHFAWRESAKRKTALKSYFTKENVQEIYKGETPASVMTSFDNLNLEKLLCAN